MSARFQRPYEPHRVASISRKSHETIGSIRGKAVDTPLHKNNPENFLKSLSPMGTISTSEEIASAVIYLTESRQITGEVLHVDGGAHNGKW